MTEKGTVNPVVKSISQTSTKSGDVTTTENIKDIGFIMDAYAATSYIDHTSSPQDKPAGHYFTEPVTFSSSWSIKNDPKWINEVPLRFWCWDKNATESGLDISLPYDNSDIRGFSYVMPDSEDKRRDIVLSFATKTWDEEKDDYINLYFFHPLANLEFEFDVPEGLKITKVAVTGLRTSGTFKMNGALVPQSPTITPDGLFAWDNDVIESKPLERIEESLGADQTEINFFVVPQKIVKDQTGIEITIKPDEKNAYTSTVIFSNSWTGAPSDHKDWKTAYYYRYRLSTNNLPSDPITFNVSLDSWGGMDFNDDSVIDDNDKIVLSPNQ